jgi:hypothetical protein
MGQRRPTLQALPVLPIPSPVFTRLLPRVFPRHRPPLLPRPPALRRGLSAIACGFLLIGLGAQPAGAQTTGSGFLSDYARLTREGPIRERYLSYSDPASAGRPIQSLCILPVARFPVDARFEGVDNALVAYLLAYADAQLRAQLGTRFTLKAAPEEADAVLQVALTGVAMQPEGKTALDLIPLRLVTGSLKDAALGKSLEATATFELRIGAARADRPWREALYPLKGKSVGRADDVRTHVTAESLIPAIDRWVSALADQIAARP